jgi:hypothetical protein
MVIIGAEGSFILINKINYLVIINASSENAVQTANKTH